MNISIKTYLKFFVAIVAITFIGYNLLNSFVFNSDVFDMNANERQSTTWEALSEREQRNVHAMKRSYVELMQLGRYYADEENWELALKNFYYAKTLFPDRVAPRKNLCYGYLKMCQKDWRFCDRGKKELYYAMQYVQPSDNSSYEYLSELVALTGIEDIIQMDEDQALAAIY